MKPYFQDDAVTIYHGDCREVMPSLASGVDLVVTDPPFYLPARVHAVRSEWPRSLSDVAVMSGYFRDVLDDILRLLSRAGGFYTFSDAVSYPVFASLLYPRVDRLQCIVWDKGVGGMGNGWRHSTELILHGAFGDTVYTNGFRLDLIRCKTIPSVERLHPAQKPTAVVTALLNAHPIGRVLDPFMGSGSILAAARLLGWRAIGIEVDEETCEVAAKRMAQGVLL